ncbi:MAG TPA: hypothetical protein VG347_01325 [Verrucomicrobiae bacterium]|nr:hypothetical protein [Verrucomicrobiae bacterium]
MVAEKPPGGKWFIMAGIKIMFIFLKKQVETGLNQLKRVEIIVGRFAINGTDAARPRNLPERRARARQVAGKHFYF